MPSLSVILITHNEARNIQACLESVAFADDVVVLDSGSTDETMRIARSLGANVSASSDWRGFGVQKNRALASATSDWVLALDADERVTPELSQEIRAHLSKASASGVSLAFALPRLTQFCGVWIRHCGWTPDYVLRIFKRGDARFSDDLVHERLLLESPSTQVVRLKFPLLHYSYPTPEHYWLKLQRYSQDWARQRHAQGQKTTIVRAALSAITAFVRSYVFQLGFLDGAMGFAVCTMQAQAAFGKYFELYCLGHKHEK